MNPDAIKDGGAAYPVAMSEQTHSNQNCEPFQAGMSLRDHFAGLAMTASLHKVAIGDYRRLAEASYELADAMIRARKA